MHQFTLHTEVFHYINSIQPFINNTLSTIKLSKRKWVLFPLSLYKNHKMTSISLLLIIYFTATDYKKQHSLKSLMCVSKTLNLIHYTEMNKTMISIIVKDILYMWNSKRKTFTVITNDEKASKLAQYTVHTKPWDVLTSQKILSINRK